MRKLERIFNGENPNPFRKVLIHCDSQLVVQVTTDGCDSYHPYASMVELCES